MICLLFFFFSTIFVGIYFFYNVILNAVLYFIYAAFSLPIYYETVFYVDYILHISYQFVLFLQVCPMLRNCRKNFSTWPCVVSYDNPKGLLKQRLSVLRKCSFLNMGILNRNVNNISRASSENKNIHLKPRNNPNIPSGSNEENSINKSKIYFFVHIFSIIIWLIDVNNLMKFLLWIFSIIL